MHVKGFLCVPYLSLCCRLCVIPSLMNILPCDHHFSSLLNQIFLFALPTKTCIQDLRSPWSSQHLSGREVIQSKYEKFAQSQAEKKFAKVLSFWTALVAISLSIRQLQTFGRNGHIKSQLWINVFPFIPISSEICSFLAGFRLIQMQL